MKRALKQVLCRDCIEISAGSPSRCSGCGSPRLISHPELFDLTIAHIDCDSFYASIEKLDNPALAHQPLIVGGGRRGVVSTCCYMARVKGVRSAMPMFKARKLCPEANIVPVRMARYVTVSRAVRDLMNSLTPLMEPLSIDEAFLDLSGTHIVHKMPPARALARFAKEVEETIGITVSIGLAPNKFLAKIASDLNKPRGFSVIGARDAETFLEDKPVSIIWGVGRATQSRLERDNIRTIADLRRKSQASLSRDYGAMGTRLFRLARAQDGRAVSPSSKAKSISSETTFERDLADINDLLPILREQAQRVSARLKKSGLAGQTLTLKLKTARFQTRTRSKTLSQPIQLAQRIFQESRALLEKETARNTPFRLLGLGVSNLRPDESADRGDLLDSESASMRTLERAMDDVTQKYGCKAIELGLTFAARHTKTAKTQSTKTRGAKTQTAKTRSAEAQSAGTQKAKT